MPVSGTEDLYSKERVVPGMVNQGTWAYSVSKYEFAKSFVAGKTVLEVGCGEGYGLPILSKNAKMVVGSDVSISSVLHASNKYRHERVRFAVMDGTSLAFRDKSFDIIVSLEVFEHIPKEFSFSYLRELWRCLKPDGTIIISTPNRVPHNLHKAAMRWENPYHTNLVSHRELSKLLKQYWEYVQIYGLRRKGNRLYRLLRLLDVFNFRLRLLRILPNSSLSQLTGVKLEKSTTISDVEIRKGQLRQCATLVAVCCGKKGRKLSNHE